MMDIARDLNVSVVTVSKVLRSQGHIVRLASACCDVQELLSNDWWLVAW
jgi:hypothetical protein